RQSAIEKAAHHVAKCAEPAQHGRDDAAYECAVAVGEQREARMGAFAVELIVEWTRAPQHAVNDVGGDPPRRDSGAVLLRLLRVVHPSLKMRYDITNPALVPRTRSSHGFSAGKFANFGFKSGTRIIDLLVSSSIPKFAQRSLRSLRTSESGH